MYDPSVYIVRLALAQVAHASAKTFNYLGNRPAPRALAWMSAGHRSRPGSVMVPGVNETPRSTSPNPAAWVVANFSDVGGVVALRRSVIVTSLFGSAP